MLNPVYIIVVALAAGFLLALADSAGRKLSMALFYLSLASLVGISLRNLLFLYQGAEPIIAATAGFPAPLSISLKMGLEEAFFISLINSAGLMTAMYLYRTLKKLPVFGMVLLLMMVMGINGLVMSRDLFNLFVFLEITAISTYSLIAIEKELPSLAAGFKYIIATGIASAVYLIGAVYVYRAAGTLNIDLLLAGGGMPGGKIGYTALFLITAAILVEYKTFPANGWGLDVYEAVNSGIGAMIAVAGSAGFLFFLYKLTPLFTPHMREVTGAAGLITFTAANIMGLKQQCSKRLLGYSSIAQMGLILSVLMLTGISRNSLFFIGGGLFISHFLAKAGLFWLAGIVKKTQLRDFSALKKQPLLLILFGLFIAALAGLPPFPGFWAKYRLIMLLAGSGKWFVTALILFGSLIETAYLFRWFGIAVKSEPLHTVSPGIDRTAPVLIFGALLTGAGAWMSHAAGVPMLFMLPAAAALVFVLIDRVPAWLKALLTILVVSLYTATIAPHLPPLSRVFAAIFLVGTGIEIIGTFRKTGTRRGLFPLLAALTLSLGNLLAAETLIQFFLSWEFMTLSSYLLITRGRKSEKPALLYILFSTGSAFLLLCGLASGFAETGLSSIAGMASGASVLTFALLSAGFLIKSGAAGVHLWVPGSYAESEDDVSAVLSSVLSKAGIFGLVVFAAAFSPGVSGSTALPALLGWIGILTAFFAGFMAIFQEDIKRLLAFSSMSQVGYMIFAFAMLSHLGWVSSIYLAFNHLFFKGALFLTIAGVVAHTKTRNMYEMGGLIKTMPLAFVSVLMSIIALSGVPPLSGFGGKWLLYTAGIEKGWYLQTGIAFFASTIAFLYCYRLIHTIFLGQPKPKFRQVREAAPQYLIPSFIFLGLIMAISVYPHLIIKPLSRAVHTVFPSSLSWDGSTVYSSLGYWNGTAVMIVTMAVFMALVIWLALVIGRVQRVKQFNIVFAAERPEHPETAHVAYNFFASYKKALGFLTTPLIRNFWNSVSEILHTAAGAVRTIYTGNGQTYALHILLFIIVFYLALGGNG